MRSNARTTIATYCLLSVAGGVSFMMPAGLEPPPAPRPIERLQHTTRPESEREPKPKPRPTPAVGDTGAADDANPRP